MSAYIPAGGVAARRLIIVDEPIIECFPLNLRLHVELPSETDLGIAPCSLVLAPWRSGDAADCKSVYPGSIPGGASNTLSLLFCGTRVWMLQHASFD